MMYVHLSCLSTAMHLLSAEHRLETLEALRKDKALSYDDIDALNFKLPK